MDAKTALDRVTAAAAAGKISASAVVNLRAWLTEPRYAEYVPQVVEHIEGEKWQTLDDYFWTVIPFGTGGRRGKMYPIGSNAINDRTIGESAQGLADYVKAQHPRGQELGCAIAYDTRHRSRSFAELCAEVMVAAGFKVYFLDGYRSTPELSFAVRFKNCACGIMVTASHNPPSDNAVKAYWSTGGQLLPPHDGAVIERVMSVQTIHRTPFAEALKAGQVVMCQADVDAGYQQAVESQSSPGPRELSVIYSPMHGVGASSVLPVLAAVGFKQVELFALHAEPDGDFPNIPGHVANPENPATFDVMIERAQQTGADVILSTDPDADRLGCAAPLGKGEAWQVFTGNQIGALLVDYVLERKFGRGKRAPAGSKSYVIKTLVTSEMIRRIADSYGVRTCGDLQVGFKYIAGTMDAEGPENFLFGCEESHGYLVGQHVRDKDAAVAALVMAELAASVKAAGQTLHEKLDALFWQHGFHCELQVNCTMPGSDGMEQMQVLMQALRSDPPRSLGGIPVARVRDYQNLVAFKPGAPPQPLVGPKGNMVILDLAAEGNYVAVRPSGTEPKVKFYLFGFEAPEQLHDLEATKLEVAQRVKRVGDELTSR